MHVCNTQPAASNATTSNFYSLDNNVAPLDDAYLAALASYTNNNNDGNNNVNNRTQVHLPTQIRTPHRIISQSDTQNNYRTYHNDNYHNDNHNNNIINNSVNTANITGNANTACMIEVNPANVTYAQRERRLRQILNC